MSAEWLSARLCRQRKSSNSRVVTTGILMPLIQAGSGAVTFGTPNNPGVTQGTAKILYWRYMIWRVWKNSSINMPIPSLPSSSSRSREHGLYSSAKGFWKDYVL